MAVIKIQDEIAKQQGCYYEYDENLDKIGQGGMSIVYKGRMVGADGQEMPVAIKKLIVRDPEVIEKARTEASIQLQNEHLVHMYGFVEADSGDLFSKKDYYIMSEYLEGVMLDSFMLGCLEDRNGEISPSVQNLFMRYVDDRKEVSTEIIKFLLSGVIALHDAGYIHRDIDPTNIMITNDGTVKLIDYGVAIQLANVSNESNSFAGKVEYASPELLMGDTARQNFTTDIYAIGIVFYQLITGNVPFKGTQYEVIQQQQNRKLPVDIIPYPSIKKIVRKATQKNQKKRYASAALFLSAVDEIPQGMEEPPINWTKIAAVTFPILMCTGVLAFVFNSSQQDDIAKKNNIEAVDVQSEPVIDPLKIEYDRSLAMMNSNNQDSINSGFINLKRIAQNGYQDAEYMVAYIYAFNPHEADANKYKKALGIQVDQHGRPTDVKVNEKAQEWLKRVIDNNSDHAYRCMYWLAAYKTSISEVKQLLNEALQSARDAGDTIFVRKIQKTINQL